MEIIDRLNKHILFRGVEKYVRHYSGFSDEELLGINNRQSERVGYWDQQRSNALRLAIGVNAITIPLALVTETPAALLLGGLQASQGLFLELFHLNFTQRYLACNFLVKHRKLI